MFCVILSFIHLEIMVRVLEVRAVFLDNYLDNNVSLRIPVRMRFNVYA